MGNLAVKLKEQCGRDIAQCGNRELYEALLALVTKEAAGREREEGQKKI